MNFATRKAGKLKRTSKTRDTYAEILLRRPISPLMSPPNLPNLQSSSFSLIIFHNLLPQFPDSSSPKFSIFNSKFSILSPPPSRFTITITIFVAFSVFPLQNRPLIHHIHPHLPIFLEREKAQTQTPSSSPALLSLSSISNGS